MRPASLIRVAVTSAAVGLILWKVPVVGLWTALAQIEPLRLLPVLAAILGMLLARWLRWHALLGEGGVNSSRTDSARSLLGGFALGAVMPGRLGELGRFLFVPASDRARVLLLNVIDRALDTWALGTIAVGSLFLVISRPAALVAAGAWVCLLPFLLGLPRITAKLGGLPWWREDLRIKLRVAGETLPNLRVWPYAALALLSSGFDLVAFYFLIQAFQDASPLVALATFPWIVFAGGLPVSLGGLGTREGAAAILLSRFAIPAAVALDVALLLFALGSLLPALIGAAWHAFSPGSILFRSSRRNRAAPGEETIWQAEFQNSLPAGPRLEA